MLDEMTDHFRNMLEKTDNMQGLRVLADVDCGFGSFATKYIREIKDEFPKKPIMLYSITGPDVNSEPYGDERSSVIKELRGYNIPLAVVNLNELVDSIVPIDLNYYGQINRFPDYITGFQKDSLFHTSSIPCLAINDFFGPLTQKKMYQDMEKVLHPLTIFRRANIHLNSIKIPFISEVGFTGGADKLFEQNKIAEFYKSKEFIHLSSPFWGPLHEKLPFHSQLNWTGAVHPSLTSTKLKEQASDFCFEHLPSHNLDLMQEKHLLPIPYPRYFSRKLKYTGEVGPKETGDFVSNLSTFSTLYTTADVRKIVDNVILKYVTQIPYRHKVQFLKEDFIEEDEFIDMRETAHAISDAYCK